jgi:hypothetical protein
MKIVTRKIAPTFPKFKKDSAVAFVALGHARAATFVRRESRGKAGVYYIVNVEGIETPIFANGAVGLTVTSQ